MLPQKNIVKKYLAFPRHGSTSISKWCTNSSQPDIETLVRISKLLNVGIEELFNKKFWNLCHTNITTIVLESKF